MARAKPDPKRKPSSLGFRPKAFSNYIGQTYPVFTILSESQQNGMAAILWSMYASRMAHNSGIEGVIPIHWRSKIYMFGSAKQFDEANAILDWFTLEVKPKPGYSAGGWTMTSTAKEVCTSYMKESERYGLTGLEKRDCGLVTDEGKPYRTPTDGIRSRTSSGNMSRFPRKTVKAAIEIDGENLHNFHYAAQAYLIGDPCPPGFEWVYEQWEDLRTGRGPNSGEDAAKRRSKMARDQASVMLDLAKRSSVAGYIIPTTYRESSAGRLYAENAINLQRCVSEVRKVALKGCFDADISNCHWSLLAQMADRLGEPAPYIVKYLNKKQTTRAEIASAVGISIDDAKFLLLALVYGATLTRSPEEQTRAIEERLGMEAAERARVDQNVLDLYSDVRRIRKAVLADYADHSNKPGFIINDAGREIDMKVNVREQLAHVLQGAESMALQAMMNALAPEIAVMQHDGLTVYSEPNLTDLEKRITDFTGYSLKLEKNLL
mgnify:CR=1 FL=1